MKRNTPYRAGTALAAIFLAACLGDVSAPAESDPLARDSALEQQILRANQAAALADAASRDTIDDTAQVEDAEVESPPAPTAAEIRALLEPPPRAPEVGRALPPAVVVAEGRSALPPAVVVAEARSALPPTVVVAEARSALPPAVVVAESAPTSKPVESASRSPEVASTLAEAAAGPPSEDAPAPPSSLVTVPAGTDLSLAAGRRICVNTSKVGDRFRARLLKGLAGGAIPSGATATIEITSLVGRLGEEDIAIDVRSINVDGRRYSIDSRVRRIELDRRPGAYRCIPDGGRITAELTEPLRVRQ